MEHYYALFLAGGGGTRLWPMSRKETPKQLLPLIDDHSMFQTSINRLAPLFTPEQIYVATGPSYVAPFQDDTPDIPATNFIVEPYGRDNAAATALALTHIHHHDPQAVVAMLTVDHYIAKKEVFRHVLEVAYQIAQEGTIVTLGISPSFPATGYGYIRQGAKLGEINGFDYHNAERFTEKPDAVRATQFLATGRYTWNSGMFIWKAERALAEFEKQQPAMAALFKQLAATIGTADYQATLDEIWEQTPKMSIDYAIMEKADNMVVIPVDIGWSDVGSWASLYDVLEQDKFGNCFKGTDEDDRIILETRNFLAFTQKLTVAIGVKDIVVVETDDALLICHKNRTQEVKEIVQYLKENERDDYL